MAVHIVYKVYANIDRSIQRPAIATAASSRTLVKSNFGGKGGWGGRLGQHDELFLITRCATLGARKDGERADFSPFSPSPVLSGLGSYKLRMALIVLTNMGSAIAIHHPSFPDLPRDILNYVSSG